MQMKMNADIRGMLKKRDKLRKQYLHTKSADDLENFRKLTNKAKQSIRGAKTRYFYQRFGGSNDSRSLWNTIRSLNLGKAAQCSLEPVVDVNNLNTHYASVSTVRDESIIVETIKEHERKCSDRPKTEIEDKFCFKYVLPEDIIQAIFSIKSKAVGFDGVCIMFLKMFLPALLPVLDHLFNYSLQHGTFPSLWEKANIIPVPKAKTPKVNKDYRLVSILLYWARF